jgi:hypothetical protein
MISEMEPLESRYEDYKLEYSPRSGVTVYKANFLEFLSIQLSDLTVLAKMFAQLFSNNAAREAAFGPQGVAGDPSRILHLAKRYVGIYDELLRWAERLRATSVPEEYRNLIDILAKYVEQPIEAIREFVKEYAEWAEQLPAEVASGRMIVVEHTVTFTVPDALMDTFRAEVARLELNFRFNPGGGVLRGFLDDRVALGWAGCAAGGPSRPSSAGFSGVGYGGKERANPGKVAAYPAGGEPGRVAGAFPGQALIGSQRPGED